MDFARRDMESGCIGGYECIEAQVRSGESRLLPQDI